MIREFILKQKLMLFILFLLILILYHIFVCFHRLNLSLIQFPWTLCLSELPDWIRRRLNFRLILLDLFLDQTYILIEIFQNVLAFCVCQHSVNPLTKFGSNFTFQLEEIISKFIIESFDLLVNFLYYFSWHLHGIKLMEFVNALVSFSFT